MTKKPGVFLARAIIGLTVILMFPPASRAQVVSAETRVPLDRYSLSPFLQESFLFLQGTTLPDMFKVDVSLGLNYMREPWRIYDGLNDSIKQAPVEDRFQIRPAVAFAFRRWFDVAIVVPMVYQTAGQSDHLTTITDQEGFNLLDPELYLKIPIFHERRHGFGLAGIGQMVFPFGSDKAFVGYHAWQGGLLVAADWRWKNFGVMLNMGVLLRESVKTLNTPIGNELLIRPGISYTLPLGPYSLSFSAEGNIATGLDYYFNRANENAFQLLFSIQIQPTDMASGLYAAVGGGSHMQGGGYGVPISNVDSRLGYSIQWQGRTSESRIAEGKEEPPAGKTPEVPDGKWEKPSGPEKVAAGPGADTAEEVGEIPTENIETGGTSGDTGEELAVVPIVPSQPTPSSRENIEPIDASTSYGQSGPEGPSLIEVSFAPSEPSRSVSAGAGGIATGSAAIPQAARDEIRGKKQQILQKLREPRSRLIIIGFADKCFDGLPYLGNQFNKELSKRRADSMLAALREIMGDDLAEVEIRTLAMGRRCANAKCRCSNLDMPECSNDRSVKIYIDHGEMDRYQCPLGEYWLAR